MGSVKKKEDLEDKEQPEEAEATDELKKEVGPPDLVPDLDADDEPETEKDKPETEDEPDEAESESAGDVADGSTPFDDDKTSEAISDIVAKESDDLLANQDAAAGKGPKVKKNKGSLLGRWWRNKWARSLTLLILFAGIAAAMIVPKTRYLILNTLGVRSSASIVVVDSTTQLPLKGVQVRLGSVEAHTDSSGRAKFANFKLGPFTLQVTQVGFEEVKRTVVIGWGSNPLGSLALKATGVQFVIEVRDYLTDQPLEGVEATDGATTAISSKEGKITLSLGSSVVAKDSITLSKAGYRSDKVTLNEDPKKPTKASMVIAKKAVFVVKKGAKYNVYKGDIDGQNRDLLLAGTGHETSNLSLVVSPEGDRAALVSTRDNKKDSDGSLLNSLVLINVDDGSKIVIAEAPQIQLIDWIGQRLIFQQVSSDTSSSNHYTVVAYNYSNKTRLQLVAAKNLGAVMSAQGFVYYAVMADPSNAGLQTGLFKVKPDSSGKQRVFEEEPVTVLRTSYNTFSLQVEDGTWYTYDLEDGSKTQVSTPSSLANRLYQDNASRSHSLWASLGKLNSHEIASGKDKTLTTISGLTYPLRWLNDTTVIYRLSTGSETADYVISRLGGTARKIADVVPSYGYAQSQ